MVLTMCFLFVVGFRTVRILRGGDPILRPIFDASGKTGNHFAMGMVCLCYAGSNSLSKLSLNFVSVPMMIVFKSCKIVCVMVGSTLINSKVYTWFEYFIAVLLVLGMILFSMADMRSTLPSLTNDFNVLAGISILLLALCFDSMLGNFQEKVQKSKVCDELDLMYVQSLVGTALLLTWTTVSGEFAEGIEQCLSDTRVTIVLLSWALSNMGGIVVMLRIVGEFSAVTAVVLSLVRKFASIIVSYTLFPKPLSMPHAVGLVLVFSSVIMHSFRKQFSLFFLPTNSLKQRDQELGLIQGDSGPK
jgi:drug/metabolite transporter (DMT)-like permease